MRRHRLFAAGVSVALLLAAGSPALAAPGNGKAKGHAKHDKPAKPAKPAKTKPAPAPKVKKSKAGLSGGGSVAATIGTAEFSVQSRSGREDKSHFNFTSADGTYKLRCRDFKYAADPANSKVVTFSDDCALTTGPENARVRTSPTVSATFTDNGQPTEGATAGPDTLTLVVNGETVVDNGVITGNIKVRS